MGGAKGLRICGLQECATRLIRWHNCHGVKSVDWKWSSVHDISLDLMANVFAFLLLGVWKEFLLMLDRPFA